MRNTRNRVTFTAVALILGLLIVAQLRSQTVNTGLARQSAQDLTLLVANLNTQNEDLRGEVARRERGRPAPRGPRPDPELGGPARRRRSGHPDQAERRDRRGWRRGPAQ